MPISTKNAARIRLGVKWAKRDIATVRLNSQIGRPVLPVLGMATMKRPGTAGISRRAYARTMLLMYAEEIHGLFKHLEPHLGVELTNELRKATGVHTKVNFPESIEQENENEVHAQDRCQTCGHIRAQHGDDRRHGGMGCVVYDWAPLNDRVYGERRQCSCEYFFSTTKP